MMRGLVFVVLGVVATAVHATEWTFGEKIVVADRRPGVFHHLDSTGRQHVTVSGNTVGVVWEDNRNGAPQVYLAMKAVSAARFGDHLRVSRGQAAADPVIASLGGNRFLVAWEEGGRIHLRVVGPGGPGPVRVIDDSPASQPSLAAVGDRVFVAYIRTMEQFGQVVTRPITINREDRLLPGLATVVDPAPLKGEQLAPVAAVTKSGVAVIWEDRRHGHTVLLYSHSPDGKQYSGPVPLNEQVQKSDVYGRGSGVTRAAVTPFGHDGLAATWMDKRGFRTGYDIFAAVRADGGKHFGRNEQVQDEFGNEIPQWHAAIAGDSKGTVVVAFDDSRDDTADVQVSARAADGSWSANTAPASGSGEQSHPAIAIDGAGGLHLVWLDRDADGAATRLFYSYGRHTTASSATNAHR